VHVLAAEEARVVVSGGRRIGGFRRERRGGLDFFVAEVAEARAGGWRFRQLFVNGERRPRARHPDRGYLAVAAPEEGDVAKPWNEGATGFRFSPGDLDRLRASPDADLTVMCRWVESRARVASIDFERSLVALREPTVFRLDPGDPWYVEGSPALLDAPGEWWLDEQAGRLLVVARPGEDLADPSVEVIAPRLDRLLELRGVAPLPAGSVPGAPGAAGSEDLGAVRFLTFEGIEFAHCEWRLPQPADGPGRSGFPQAAVGVPGAIAATFARGVRLERCAVRHLGTYAIELGGGCSENALVSCELSDLGAGGVKIGETSIAASPELRASGNSVLGCRILDGGRIFHSAVGIWVGQSPGNRIEGNEIADFYYSGISLGWTWGYGAADAAGQRVVANHVHHVGRRADGDGPILSDMGGVYTLGPHEGTEIARNWFHDVAALRYGGWGIYFDEGTTRIAARDNLVARTTHGGFHQHYGRENLVERNVFAFGRDAQVQRSRPEPHLSFAFRENVVLFDRGGLFAGDLSDGHFVFERNLYWRAGGGEIRFAGRTFAEWQAAGFDRGSLLADPLFAAPAQDDWSLAESSPARALLGRGVFVPPLSPDIPWARERPRARER
jgi:hypothetical protein